LVQALRYLPSHQPTGQLPLEVMGGVARGGKRAAAPKKRSSVAATDGGKQKRVPCERSKRKVVPSDRRGSMNPSITEKAVALQDHFVAEALSDFIPRRPGVLLNLMRRWEKPILKAKIPGKARHRPSRCMLAAAKRRVLRFYAHEAALGDRSDIAKAFRLASGEHQLRLDWDRAMKCVRKARYDNRQEIDEWDECLAMSSGESNLSCEIFVCGTKKMTLRALTSLICHEGLHNLARRTRPGNTFLAEDIEHMAMALVGDPQLIHEGEL